MALSDTSKRSLAYLLETLEQTEPLADYLISRGLTSRAVSMFHLGAVPGDCSAEWSRFRGMLAIPYMTVAGPVAVKFRQLGDELPKYNGPAGQSTHLFNAVACQQPSGQVVITEGELDAITMHAECSIPAVGIAGVGNWKPHYKRCVEGFNDIVVLCDNDEGKGKDTNPGLQLALRIKAAVPASRIVTLPPGEDVNSYFLKYGRDKVLELVSGD